MSCAAAWALSGPVVGKPFIPAGDQEVLADLPAGARHAELSVRNAARARLDVALPLAQFYIGQARASGDLRFLGYAEMALAPWILEPKPDAAALVMQATLEQSRHEFKRALETLDRALGARPDDPQAWLTRATVLRVLGRYREAGAACTQFARRADPGVSLICREGLRALNGHLASAYALLGAQGTQGMLDPERGWRDCELGDMAVRLGRDAEAERWYRSAMALNPHDGYVRAALADLLLRTDRQEEVAPLLAGRESIEPLLLRLAIAQKRLHDPHFAHSRDLLQAAFDAEAARGEPVHLREQARFLLDVVDQPRAALRAALANWNMQREPDDVLVLIDAARADGSPERAGPAWEFVRAQGIEDARLKGASGAQS